MSDIAILLQSAAFKLTFAFAAVCLMFWTLRHLDKLVAVNFTDIIQHLRDGNTAVAVYYGLRIVAVSILIGMALG